MQMRAARGSAMQQYNRRPAGRVKSRPTQRGAVSEVDMESPTDVGNVPLIRGEACPQSREGSSCDTIVPLVLQRDGISAGHPTFAAIPAARPCTLPAHSGVFVCAVRMLQLSSS